MTDASRHFVTPRSLELASGGKVYSGLFQDPMAHITLARDADVMLVAPATAHTIGKLASGLAGDLVSACFMALGGRAVIAPAMNWRMYEHPVLRRNLRSLRSAGVVEVPPGEGRLACGEEGTGRMADVERIVEAVRAAAGAGDLSGRRILITAGPSREHLDAVRFLSNPSTGRMGYALARAASLRGAEVTLVSGPTSLEPPSGVKFIPVLTAKEMKEAVMKEIEGAEALIMAAAVSDFSPRERAAGKLEKSSVTSVELEETPDILREVGGLRDRPLVVGFAAEAGGGLKRAREKLRAKNADVVVFNDLTEPGSGFAHETNRITIIDRSGETGLPLLTKEEASHAVLDRVARALEGRPS